jgi:hypothetical protein
MPVKRRTAKRLVNPEREYVIWEALFATGGDYFREAGEIGLAVGAYGEVPIEAAREAWQRLGARYMAENPRDGSKPWALKTFGEPQ